MVENLTDAEILQGLKQYDEKVTSEFFYDTCHIAYYVDDKKYGLRYKTGMDFYSLAHEYYLRLCNNHWQQLEKRKPHISLANWTMNGFHYLVRERLKTYSQGHFEESIEERASHGQVLFDAPVDDTRAEVTEMVEEICHSYYGSDRMSQGILRMILIMGMKGKEVASLMGITPAAVSQRYHTMMDRVVRPYFLKYYAQPQISLSQPSPIVEEIRFSYKAAKEKGRMSSADSIFGKLRKSFSLGDDTRNESMEATMSVEPKRRRITPPIVQELRENEIFVFGSDLRGLHCGGTAYQALRCFGAQLGKGVGPQGQCYAIPTIVGGLVKLQPYIADFNRYVVGHPQHTFLVTAVGCGIAGFTPMEIAPLFSWAADVDNICLPQEFWAAIDRV